MAEADSETAYVPVLIQIPAGEFIQGSDEAERECGYQPDEKAYAQHSENKCIVGRISKV